MIRFTRHPSLTEGKERSDEKVRRRRSLVQHQKFLTAPLRETCRKGKGRWLGSGTGSEVGLEFKRLTCCFVPNNSIGQVQQIARDHAVVLLRMRTWSFRYVHGNQTTTPPPKYRPQGNRQPSPPSEEDHLLAMATGISDQLRYIVEKLNREPYNKRLSVIMFDQLDSFSLLQVLNDVLAQVSPEHNVDLREEPPEQMAIRILTFLRVLKYKPRTDTGEGMNSFRHGLLKGDKTVIYPLLQWLLDRTQELKKRAYLARFLVIFEVPAEHMQDDTVVETYEAYQQLMETFKELHKASEQERSTLFNTADVRKDIESMEEETQQLLRQLDRLKKRVESFPNHQEMLDASKKLRKEREHSQQLEQQHSDQRNQLLHVQQKLQRLTKELSSLRSSTSGLTAETLIAKLEDEVKVQHLLARENLPKKIDAKRQQCIELEKVLLEPVVSSADLVEIQLQIEEANAETQKLMEKRVAAEATDQENLTLFRQQASLISHKKDAAAESLKSLTDELAEVEKELQDKNQLLEQLGGAELVREEEFKKYVGRLRSLSNAYKKKKEELSSLRAEFGVLSRTEEILKSRDENVQEFLANLEEKKGVSGFRQTQDSLEKVSAMKSDVDERKEQTLQDMSLNVVRLTRAIEQKKMTLAPLIREVRPLRQQHQELKSNHTEKKAGYDQMAVGLRSNRSQLENEVRGLWEECMAEESRYHYLQCMLQSVHLHQQRVAAEMKSIVTKDPAEKKKSMRDQLTRKIQEQEHLGRALKDKQRAIKESHGFAMHQVKMWTDLQRLFKVKHECFRHSQQQKLQAAAVAELASDGERLVLD